MKNIKTLIQDIYHVVGTKQWFTQAIAEGFSGDLGRKIVEVTGRPDEVPRLRLSQMGPKCPCQLWHSIHTPELAQPIQPWTQIKFTYGHILESYVISMAKAAGHEVTGEQDELVVDGIVGHRDCVIDGCVVDVKSAGRLSFQKFRDGSIRDNDSFGYLDQLDAYLLGSRGDHLVRNKSTGYLLAINQELGHLALYEHHLREESIRQRIRDHRAVVALDQPPRCTCEEVPDGKSGNIRLGVTASYNAFKYSCKPGLRGFLYSDGPRWLTKVVRKPDVPEIDRNGKIIYN
jgi:hypothetical protein